MDDKTTVVQPDEAPNPRRALLTALLGGLGATAVAGCLDAAGEPVGTAAQALMSGTNFIWFDAIDDGTTVSLKATVGPTSGSQIAVAGGYARFGDGGGGIFYWDPAATTGDDGTVIAVGSAGAWRRIFSGPIDVRWFGATPALTDAAPRIQKAIDLAGDISSNTLPGEVYIPRGEYTIMTPLRVPRLGFYRSLSIRGDGVAATSLVGGDGFPEFSPVMMFDGPINTDTYFFRLEGMTIQRRVPGAVFSYVPYTDHPDGAVDAHGNPDPLAGQLSRMHNSVFRDLYIACRPLANPPATYTQASPLYLHHCHDTIFDNVIVEGGESALRMEYCSRCCFVKLSVGIIDGSSRSGIHIHGGGSHTFRLTRIEGPGNPNGGLGYGMYIDDASQLLFDSLDYENHNGMAHQIYLASGREFTFIATNLNGGASSGKNGLFVGSGVRHVRFIGGVFAGFANGTIVQLADEASDVFFDHVRIAFVDDPNASLLFGNARRVQANFIWTEPFGANGSDSVLGGLNMTRGMIGTLHPPVGGPANVSTVRGYDVWRVSSPTTIDSLVDGYDGQVVTLILAAATTLNAGGQLRLLGGGSTTLGPNATIRLIYDLTQNSWYELSRSQD